MGEVIPLEFAFSSSEKGRWKLDGGLYDRSGRLSEDASCLDPSDGACDPLAGYWEGGIFGGGLRQMPILADQPQIMNFDLNEWWRIDRPGKYRLYVLSSRLTDMNQKSEQHNAMAVVSNIVAFDVLAADKEWEREELAQIAKAIDAAPGRKRGRTETQRHGWRPGGCGSWARRSPPWS